MNFIHLRAFQRRVREVGWLALGLVWCSIAGAAAPDVLIGDWECAAGPCTWEVVQFVVEADVPTYRTWLHDRPAVIDATWSLEEDLLTIRYRDDSTERWRLVSSSPDELQLRAEGQEDVTVLRRIPQ